jgi:hypothetical protein
MKIYCDNCKYQILRRWSSMCKLSKKITIHDTCDRPNIKIETYNYCENLNYNNNCPKYQPDLIQRLINMLIRLKNKLFRTKDRI